MNELFSKIYSLMKILFPYWYPKVSPSIFTDTICQGRKFFSAAKQFSNCDTWPSDLHNSVDPIGQHETANWFQDTSFGNHLPRYHPSPNHCKLCHFLANLCRWVYHAQGLSPSCVYNIVEFCLVFKATRKNNKSFWLIWTIFSLNAII